MRSPVVPGVSWRLPFLALLLFVSGACALVYQTAWLREFRLIFGGATPATAAVLAVFMGGLGAGGAWFGKRAEQSTNLLRLYARLEIGIGVAAALTPFLLEAVRALYVKTGGVLTLGSFGSTVAHLVLSLVVLGVPCFLLGGNLPPAVKWIETDDDRQRGALGVIYGCNAFGAVIGVLGSTFWSLEHLGTRGTLWAAAAGNVLLGLVAWWVGGKETAVDGPGSAAAGTASVRGVAESGSDSGSGPMEEKAPARFVFVAAGVSGFIFFLAELVWFRLLTPLLGGSVYCFGLILAQALFGIALGGWLYRAWIASRPGRTNLGTLAVVSTAQAAAAAVPWAMGDGLAVMSYHWQQARAFGFSGLVLGWSCTVALMVLIPSVLAGMQFPLLVGLLGEGRKEAARQVGAAYAANTAGAIVGSIAGGFLLLPWLTAPGCWRLVVALMLALGFAALLSWERPWKPSVMFATLVLGVSAVVMAFHSRGPTAAWRHTAIGYGVVRSMPNSPAELEDLHRANRRHLAKEYEGRESSIAIMSSDEGWALYSNGKADGSALQDAGTQVMLGLVSAMQHSSPRSAFVIGLGTGTSAGWLADVPGMERVDVVELESKVAEAAGEFFGPVNRRVMEKTNVAVIIGDAREVLLATDRSYDLVVSEPPNPYRAGVASLFTREYYEAVRRRLAPGGIFSQWLQGYQLSAESLQVVYATLLSVFPYVETWATQGSDLLFVAHLEVPAYPPERLRDRLGQPLFQEALARAWWGRTPEDFVARHFAGTPTARRAAAGARGINTDDRNLLEYGLARAQLGRPDFHYRELLAEAVATGDDLPPHLRPLLNQARVLEARLHLFAAEQDLTEPPPELAGDLLARAEAMVAWAKGQYGTVLTKWTGPATSPADSLMLAISASRSGTAEQARRWLGPIRANWPVDAEVANAWLAYRDGAHTNALEHLVAAMGAMEVMPWAHRTSIEGIIELSALVVSAYPGAAEALLAAWRRPFCVGQLRRSSAIAWYRLAYRLPYIRRLEVLDAIGPDYPFAREFLEFRWRSLDGVGHPFAPAARRELERFLTQEGRGFRELLESKETPESTGNGVREGGEGGP